MMNRKIFFFGALLFLASCSNGSGSDEDNEVDVESDIEAVDMDFDDADKFDDPVKLKLLEELNICGPTENDSMTVACSPKFFTFIKLKEDKSLNDAFILKIRSMTMLKNDPAPFPERRILVFERENGQLVRTNGFVGELVQFEGEKNGVKSPLIALYDPEEDILFHCLFEWSDGRYVFKSCEGLDRGPGPKPIKAALKDSLSKEIYTEMITKSRIFQMKRWFFIGILLVSCHSEKGMKSVSYDGLLNDESSKVWLVDQTILESANVGAYEVADKDVLIFHKTGEFQYTPLKKIGTSKIPTGNYVLDSDKKVLSLYFKKEIWRYNLTYIEEDSIFLLPSDDSETRYALKIIPLPLL